jgi:poly(3-hydroxybutyrate) depolymerase
MRSVTRAAVALVALIALNGPVPSDSAPPVGPARASDLCSDTGAVGQRTVTGLGDGLTHRYYWRVPDTAAPDPGRPVLIWLHGDGDDGSARAPRFWPVTDPDGAIIVTPDGTDQTWNHRVADVPGTPYDTKFLSRVIDHLLACGSVDPDRIFVGGVSRGAYMPYYLLQREAALNRIAAVAVNAGLLYCEPDDNKECNSDTSDATLHSADARILHLHGTNDRAVSPPPLARFTGDGNVDWRVFYPMRLWAEQHGCWTDRTGGPNNGRLRETYQVAGHRARVFDLTGHGPACDGYQLILVDRGGHVIDGQEARIWAFLMDRPTCQGIGATIEGSAGPDQLAGTGGADVIVGLGGDDTISALGGDDIVCGDLATTR